MPISEWLSEVIYWTCAMNMLLH